MALDTDVIGSDKIKARRVYDICACWMRDMITARAMASLATHVPFSHLFRLDIKIHRVTAVAQGAGWPMKIVRRIIRHPPIILRDIGPPLFVRDVPLRRL